MSIAQSISVALKTLKHYKILVDGKTTKMPKTEYETAIVDLFTDIRHFADEHGVNFYDCLQTSYMHYCGELKWRGSNL